MSHPAAMQFMQSSPPMAPHDWLATIPAEVRQTAKARARRMASPATNPATSPATFANQQQGDKIKDMSEICVKVVHKRLADFINFFISTN